MKNLWVKLGCFLTGQNYNIVKLSSEASIKTVRKNFSALLIVMFVWGTIGFVFTQRYLQGSMLASTIGAIVMVIMVIQFERQIILSLGKNHWLRGFRLVIGFVMAVIGSLILDQIMFKEDVEKQKIETVQTEVNELLPIKTQELSEQIRQLQQEIILKEKEQATIIAEVEKNPTVSSRPSSTVQYQQDTITGEMVAIGKVVTSQQVANPKADLIPQISDQIQLLRQQKIAKENQMLNIQQVLETELKSKVGFLDELTILISILTSSPIAAGVWLLIFIFFLSIELFVLVNKFSDKETDYDRIVLHQLNVRLKMLEKLNE